MSDCCKRPKNPCMVCRRTVTAKTGLQCQGSCKSWIHFTCCSYTPGKIKDIKAKIIKVRCPCPDCSTQGPKEIVMKDSSFTCINKTCPINNPPKCAKDRDNNNKMVQQPSPCKLSCKEWPGVPCSGNSCQANTQEECCPPDPRACPIPTPPPGCPPPPPPPAPCIPAPVPCPRPQPPPKPCSPSTPPCRPQHHRPSEQSDMPQHMQTQQSHTPPQYYQQNSPGHTSNTGSPARRMSPSSTPVMPSISLVENMCETVGL
ncbi:pollen-specific leucine-rich repeat extensin-like protein 2 [Leguminivora glycinivorella]|nr:pollen-specific leucine-rich repeat extensin-like protein 2 [Leguminivora glycinivorella]